MFHTPVSRLFPVDEPSIPGIAVAADGTTPNLPLLPVIPSCEPPYPSGLCSADWSPGYLAFAACITAAAAAAAAPVCVDIDVLDEYIPDDGGVLGNVGVPGPGSVVPDMPELDGKPV